MAGKAGGGAGCGCLVLIVLGIMGLIMNGCTALLSPNAEVVSVPDGSTVVVQRGGDEERIVLEGVTTPAAGECLSEEARAHLEALVPVGSEVELRDLDDGSADVMDEEGDSVNEQMLHSGLAMYTGLEPPRAYSEWVNDGLHDMDVPCTVPGQIIALTIDINDLDDRDRGTAVATALVIAEAKAIKKKVNALAAEVRSAAAGDYKSSGPAMILKSGPHRERISDDLDRLTRTVDGTIQDLEESRAWQEEREAEDAAWEAEWEAGAAEREAERQRSEAERQEILRQREASGGGGAGYDGYTGKRCYEPGGQTYKPC